MLMILDWFDIIDFVVHVNMYHKVLYVLVPVDYFRSAVTCNEVFIRLLLKLNHVAKAVFTVIVMLVKTSLSVGTL